MATLQASDLLYTVTCAPDEVGVHPANRFGAGLDSSDVHSLLGWVSSQGWSFAETRGARAIEMSPGADGEAQLAFNKNLADGSDGLIASPVRALMKILSVTCSHTNAGPLYRMQTYSSQTQTATQPATQP